MEFLQSTPSESRLALLVAGCFLIFLLHLFLYPERAGLRRDIFGKALRARGLAGRQATIWNLHLERLTAGLVLGGGSALLVFALDLPVAATLGLSTNKAALSLGVGLATWIAALPFAYLIAKLPQIKVDYPEIKVERWTGSLALANTASWMLYLVGYELLFRGLLLLPLVDAWGLWPALAVNTTIYAMSHTPKCWVEVAGALFLGVFCGLVCVYTGSVIGPIFIHGAVAVLTGTAVVYATPQLRPGGGVESS